MAQEPLVCAMNWVWYSLLTLVCYAWALFVEPSGLLLFLFPNARSVICTVMMPAVSHGTTNSVRMLLWLWIVLGVCALAANVFLLLHSEWSNYLQWICLMQCPDIMVSTAVAARQWPRVCERADRADTPGAVPNDTSLSCRLLVMATTSDAASCCVCFETTTTCLRSCEHVMCESCAQSWFGAHKSTCPVCRQESIVQVPVAQVRPQESV